MVNKFLLSVPALAMAMFAQAPATPQQTQTPRETPSSSATATATSQQTTGDKTIVGILVDASCTTMPKTSASAMPGASMGKGTPSSNDLPPVTNNTSGMSNRDRNANRPLDPTQTSGLDRNTTGSELERQTGSNRASGAADRAAGSADRMSRTTAGGATDTQAGNNDQTNWDRSCYISSGSHSFMLETPDGKMLHFDANGDTQIKAELDSTSRVAAKNKILRVRVTGKVDGDTIHMTKIVM
jgi:hypothetical protein